MSITLVSAHRVKTMHSVLSLASVTFVIVLLDGQEITVNRENTVCLIRVSTMVLALIRIHLSNVFVLTNGIVKGVINMTFVVQTHVNMEVSVKILKITLNVIVYKAGQDHIVKHVIIVTVRRV